MSGARITQWNGQQVAERVRAAAAEAINETIQAAADQAAAERTGKVADVQVVDTATPESPTGRWGVPPEPGGDPYYELFAETGTAHQPGDAAKRRAADAQYPELAERIRGRLGA